MLIAQAKPVDYDEMANLAKSKVPDKPVVKLNKFGAKKLWDNYTLIGEVEKNHRLRIRVAAATRDGYRCVVMREFYYNEKYGDWRPGRNGMVIPLKSPRYDPDTSAVTILEPMQEFIAMFKEAVTEAETMELVDSEKAMYILPRASHNSIVKAKEIDK